jgi:haloalkane dehalogenase
MARPGRGARGLTRFPGPGAAVDAYRTPDERFANLPGFPFEPHYAEIDGLRMHFVDEGAGDPILLFHGEPTWSFLYRKMIPILTAAGHRAVAPDYFGFGRSDKPTDRAFYTYDRHVSSVTGLVEQLGLSRITVVVQDWGGPIGLRLAVEHRERVERLVVLNTGLSLSGEKWPTPAFMQWRSFAERAGLDLPVGFIVQGATATDLPPEVVAGYEAPFPTPEARTGAAMFPLLVPIAAGDPGLDAMLATRDGLRRWDKPALVLFSDGDPIFSTRVAHSMARTIPTAGEPQFVAGASHFLQEDKGEEIAERIVGFLAETGSGGQR